MGISLICCGAGIVSIALSSLTGIAFLAVNSWFGAADLEVFVDWSIFFALITACIAALVRLLLSSQNVGLRYTVASAIGLTSGYAFTSMVAWQLGSWFAAFSFPVIFCWMLSGLGSMLFTVSVASRHAA
jgi:hypothetical protein